nr:MAG: hypothetical protein [Microvirus sp.]
MCVPESLALLDLVVYIYISFFTFGVFMKPLSRGRVSKGRSARRFRAQSARTKAPNVVRAPMRGGWRL